MRHAHAMLLVHAALAMCIWAWASAPGSEGICAPEQGQTSATSSNSSSGSSSSSSLSTSTPTPPPSPSASAALTPPSSPHTLGSLHHLTHAREAALNASLHLSSMYPQGDAARLFASLHFLDRDFLRRKLTLKALKAVRSGSGGVLEKAGESAREGSVCAGDGVGQEAYPSGAAKDGQDRYAYKEAGTACGGGAGVARATCDESDGVPRTEEQMEGGRVCQRVGVRGLEGEEVGQAVEHGRTNFVVAFHGTSITAGYDNHRSQACPDVMRRELDTAFRAAGIQLIVRNHAMHTNPPLPAALCVEALLGDDVDVGIWEFGVMASGGQRVAMAEMWIRNVLSLKQRPAVCLLDRGWGARVPEGGVIEKILRERRRGLPKEYTHEFVSEDGEDVLGHYRAFGIHTQSMKEAVYSMDHRHEYDFKALLLDGKSVASSTPPRHPGPKGHELRGRILAYHYLRLLADALSDAYFVVLEHGVDGIEQYLAEHHDPPPSPPLPSPIACPATLCLSPPTCHTTLHPRASHALLDIGAFPYNITVHDINATAKAWESSSRAAEPPMRDMDNHPLHEEHTGGPIRSVTGVGDEYRRSSSSSLVNGDNHTVNGTDIHIDIQGTGETVQRISTLRTPHTTAPSAAYSTWCLAVHEAELHRLQGNLQLGHTDRTYVLQGNKDAGPLRMRVGGGGGKGGRVVVCQPMPGDSGHGDVWEDAVVKVDGEVVVWESRQWMKAQQLSTDTCAVSESSFAPGEHVLEVLPTSQERYIAITAVAWF